jgi:hypothetical protein
VTFRDWRDGLLLGAALGAVVLGLCGRVAMRAIAVANEQEPVATVAGTLTVVAVAAANGALGGAFFLASRWIARRRRLLGEVVFWGLALGLALQILRPVSRQRLEFFLPLATTFSVALEVWWWRRAVSRSSSAP